MTDPQTSPVTWDDDGAPRSRRHGDVYFSKDDGLAESRAVFLAGCDLPAAWADRRVFTVGELGFGTGLNVAALLHLWIKTRPTGSHLSIFTIENAPLAAAEALRALSVWPELEAIAHRLTSNWPGRARGFHRIDLADLHATLDVAVMDVAEALAAWSGPADAWFLDGFAPSLNPEMWRPEVLGLIARRSAPGASAATYTVAGAVRRGLAEVGFTVDRAPGHGRKRERLIARWPGPAAASRLPRVAVIGAGIAGASLHRAFAALGIGARVFDVAGPGAGASGAPAGLMAPRLDAGLGPGAELFAQAARQAAALYDTIPGAVIARGALQLAQGPKDPGRFTAIAGSDLFEPLAMTSLAPDATVAQVGEAAPEGLAMAGARVFRPGAILEAWLGPVEVASAARLTHDGYNWRILDQDGEVLAAVDVVCVAAGMASADLVSGIALTAVRGQASVARRVNGPGALVFGAYVIPMGDGLLFGATHDRDDRATDLRTVDRERNTAAVAAQLPGLASRLRAAAGEAWSAVRATTRDYLPLAGSAGDAMPGLMVLTGLGSRGFCLAPLLAEHIAALAVGAPSPLPAALADLVDPGRFARRAARKGRPVS